MIVGLSAGRNARVRIYTTLSGDMKARRVNEMRKVVSVEDGMGRYYVSSVGETSVQEGMAKCTRRIHLKVSVETSICSFRRLYVWTPTGVLDRTTAHSPCQVEQEHKENKERRTLESESVTTLLRPQPVPVYARVERGPHAGQLVRRE